MPSLLCLPQRFTASCLFASIAYCGNVIRLLPHPCCFRSARHKFTLQRGVWSPYPGSFRIRLKTRVSLTAACLSSPDCEDTLPDIYVQRAPVHDYIYSH